MNGNYTVKPLKQIKTPILDYKAGLSLKCNICGNEDQTKFLTVTNLSGNILTGFVCAICEANKTK